MSTEDTMDPVTPPAVVEPITPPPAPAPVVAPVATPAATAATPSREKAFTQTEVNDQIGRARQEGRKSAYAYLQKELGVPLVNEAGDTTLDALRGLIQQARTQETAASAQLRDLLTQKTTLEAQVAEKDSEVRGAYARAQQALRLGEAKALAVQLGFNDPRDAVVMLGDLSRFEADLEAETVTGLHEALTQLATEKPYLLKTANPSPAAAVAAPPAIPPTPKPANQRDARQVEDEDRLAAVARQAQSFF